MQEKYSISIVVPIYNQNSTIVSTVTSVFNALDSNDEAIFIDDCSTDNSFIILQEICKKYDNIHCYRNDKNMGHIYTLNRAISLSANEYITVIGGDDLLSKGFCSSVKKSIRSTDDFIFPPVIRFRKECDINIQEQKIIERDYSLNKFDIGWGWGKYKGKKYGIIGATIKKETIKALGLFSNDSIVEDYNLFLHASGSNYSLRLISALPSFYRINDNSLSSKTWVMYKEDIKLLLKYFNISTFIILFMKRTLSFIWFLINKRIIKKWEK
ncbi:glycosyltransferase family 2 protein [Photobacterium damselae]